MSEWLLPDVKFAQCPIKTSLGIMGKKWTMLILRDIGILGVDRFNRLLDSIPGLTARVLSMRLKELERGIHKALREWKVTDDSTLDRYREGKRRSAYLVTVYRFRFEVAC